MTIAETGSERNSTAVITNEDSVIFNAARWPASWEHTQTAAMGEALSVLLPVYYRHIYQNGIEKFVWFAEHVWKILRMEAIRK